MIINFKNKTYEIHRITDVPLISLAYNVALEEGKANVTLQSGEVIEGRAGDFNDLAKQLLNGGSNG